MALLVGIQLHEVRVVSDLKARDHLIRWQLGLLIAHQGHFTRIKLDLEHILLVQLRLDQAILLPSVDVFIDLLVERFVRFILHNFLLNQAVDLQVSESVEHGGIVCGKRCVDLAAVLRGYRAALSLASLPHGLLDSPALELHAGRQVCELLIAHGKDLIEIILVERHTLTRQSPIDQTS